jgi:hypothetical protein
MVGTAHPTRLVAGGFTKLSKSLCGEMAGAFRTFVHVQIARQFRGKKKGIRGSGFEHESPQRTQRDAENIRNHERHERRQGKPRVNTDDTDL